jgi:dipeptidyl aminopeptidase/acylaminoacyl peptidase
LTASTRHKTDKQALVPDDILRIATIDDARISPDGSMVAYAVRRSVIEENCFASAIFAIPADATQQHEPRKLTSGMARDTAPRWSPDGRKLAFISDRTGVNQLYVLDLQCGEARQVTELERGASYPAWSPDGSRIAVLSSTGNGVDDELRSRSEGFIRHIRRLQYRFDETGYIDDRFNHIWIVEVESGDARRLTWGAHPVQSLAWSSDSQQIAFAANRVDSIASGLHSQLHIISALPPEQPDLDGHDAAQVVPVATLSVTSPVWSPDGSAIAFIGQPEGARAGANNEVYSVDPGSGEVKILTGDFDRSPAVGSFSDVWSPRDSTPLCWRADGAGILFVASDRGKVGIYEVSSDGEGVNQIVGGDRSISLVSQSADGSNLAFVAGSFTNPCDLYHCEADGSGERRLTWINDEVLGGLAIQQPELLTFESHDGGFQVDAWRIRPHRFDADQEYPLVQTIHGGPHSIFGHTFFFDMQLWASQGWNVLFVNPRGSQGYGEAFATAAIGDWGGGDWIEQEMALDLAIELGGVDTGRLGVTGLSYGGFMTNWIVGHSNRYCVGVTENSISNLVSFFTVSDIGSYWLEREMEREFWSNLDWYMERSPIAYVPNMTTPLLFLQAETDWRCPVEEGEQLYTALMSRGVPCEMVRFPGESHVQLSIGKPETRLVRRQVTLDWFRQYL